jgi:hypothetical protein
LNVDDLAGGEHTGIAHLHRAVESDDDLLATLAGALFDVTVIKGILRTWSVSEAMDEITFRGSRCVCTITASGYSATRVSSCHRCAGDFNDHWPPTPDCKCCRKIR